jgi:TonB family protein
MNHPPITARLVKRSLPLRLWAYLTCLVLLSGCGQLPQRTEYSIGNDETPRSGAKAESEVIRSVLAQQINPPLDAPLQLLKVELPEYQSPLRRRRIEGRVHLHFRVLPDGSVSDLRIIESDHEDLSALVLDAMSKWRFAPPTRNGVGVSLPFLYNFVFKLK